MVQLRVLELLLDLLGMDNGFLLQDIGRGAGVALVAETHDPWSVRVVRQQPVEILTELVPNLPRLVIKLRRHVSAREGVDFLGIWLWVRTAFISQMRERARVQLHGSSHVFIHNLSLTYYSQTSASGLRFPAFVFLVTPSSPQPRM